MKGNVMEVNSFVMGAMIFLLGFVVGYYLNPHWPRKAKLED
jgi:hypothetical protein